MFSFSGQLRKQLFNKITILLYITRVYYLSAFCCSFFYVDYGLIKNLLYLGLIKYLTQYTLALSNILYTMAFCSNIFTNVINNI